VFPLETSKVWWSREVAPEKVGEEPAAEVIERNQTEVLDHEALRA
jgi:hypothetical protein